MTKSKKREKFFLWIEQYEAFKAIANERGISASELLKEAVAQFDAPSDLPKKARNLTVDQQTSDKIQAIAGSGSAQLPARQAVGAVMWLIMSSPSI